MDSSLIVSAMFARHQAQASLAFAARMQDISPKAAARLLVSFNESAEQLERIATQLATGAGEALDITA